MRRRFHAERGQALIMVTFACTAMLGLMGLAVDLGWAYFTRKMAQSAADAAALGAAGKALEDLGQSAAPSCGPFLACQPLAPCPAALPQPPATTVDVACLYAARNGFRTGARQTVSVEAGAGTVPPTAPGVVTDYWITVRAAERIPQLFASVVAAYGTSGARATAAIVETAVPASLVLLNRENDCLPMENSNQLTCGVNLMVSANDNQGHFAVEALGGIYMASQKHGNGDGRYAGENTGGGTVSSPFTEIRGAGSYMLSGSSRWVATPRGNSTAVDFLDPMRGKGQPRPPTGLPDWPILGGAIMGGPDPDQPVVRGPGNYYAAEIDSRGQMRATGEPIAVSGAVTFSDGGTGFGGYVFYGGLDIKGAGTTVTFYPGMYVLAGVKSQSNGSPAPLLGVTANAAVRDMTNTTGANSDAGEIFVFTDANYSGQGQPLEVPSLVQPIAPLLRQGTTGFHAGSDASASIALHGLNRNSGALPEHLQPFAPVVVWQDQANSVVKHTPAGYVDTSCGEDGCPNTALASRESPELRLQGSPNVHFYGTIYQPRGAWTTLSGGGDYMVPLQIIAGAFRVQGNAALSMAQLPAPVMRRSVALVE